MLQTLEVFAFYSTCGIQFGKVGTAAGKGRIVPWVREQDAALEKGGFSLPLPQDSSVVREITWNRVVTVHVLLIYWVSCLIPTWPNCRIPKFSARSI